MAYIEDGGICPKLLVGLELFTGSQSDPETKATQAGMLKSLYDPSIEQTGVSSFDKDNGHYGNVRYEWLTRGNENDGQNSTGAFDCNETAEDIDRREDEFTIDTTAPTKRTFSVDQVELAALCEEVTQLVDMPLLMAGGINLANATQAGLAKASSDSITTIQDVMRKFLSRINGIRMGVNDAVIDLIIPIIGEYVDGSTTKDFDMMNSSDDSLNNKGFNDFLRNYVTAELSANGNPILVGFNNLFDAMSTKKISSLNDGGVNFDRIPDFRYYEDFKVGNKLGDANSFISFAPGTLALGTYNQNQGSYAGYFANVHRGVFPDVEMGRNSRGAWNLKYDVFIQEICDATSNMQYAVTMAVAYDIFSQPLAAYQDQDRLQGTNGIFKGRVTKA